jgi:hypothetical protein
MAQAIVTCKELMFACKMYKMFPKNREKYRAHAQACVSQLESTCSKDPDVFTAWKIGCIALDLMNLV